MTDRSLIEPSDDEARNGWTAESLMAYVAAVNESTQRKLDWSKRKAKPIRQNSKFNPFTHWRRGR